MDGSMGWRNPDNHQKEFENRIITKHIWQVYNNSSFYQVLIIFTWSWLTTSVTTPDYSTIESFIQFWGRH